MIIDVTLEGKKIILGVTGSIAAYKALELVRLLRKGGADVQVILSEGAKNFVSPLSFQTVSGHGVLEKQFEKMQHIDLGNADAFLVAPATANFCAKAAVGLADDLLTTTLQAFAGPVLIAPAMNDVMYDNQVLRNNINRLRGLPGYHVIEPEKGDLACGKKGQGRLADPRRIVECVVALFIPQDLKGKHVLVTAGPTREYIDPVRFISNASSGKMGFAFAQAAKARGASVTLVCGPTEVQPPAVRVVQITTTRQMLEVVQKFFPKTDVFVAAAAPSDFKLKARKDKIKKKAKLSLALEQTPDILAWCGVHKTHQKLVGFALETRPSTNEVQRKIKQKNLDALVLNTPENIGTDYAKGKLFLGNKAFVIRRQNKLSFAHAVLSKIFETREKTCR